MLDVLSEHVNFNCILSATKQRIDMLSAGTLRFYCNLRETGEFIADQSLVKDLMLALAENAMMFLDKKKPEHCFSVKIESNRETTRILAADNGKGDLPASKNDPSALFFNTIRELVSSLKGAINIDATPGIGTYVEITFPAGNAAN